METEIEKQGDNLTKLRSLVNELDNHHQKSDEYQLIIKDIERVIKEEKKIISKLSRMEIKLVHYENICSAILTLIATAKVS